MTTCGVASREAISVGLSPGAAQMNRLNGSWFVYRRTQASRRGRARAVALCQWKVPN